MRWTSIAIAMTLQGALLALPSGAAGAEPARNAPAASASGVELADSQAHWDDPWLPPALDAAQEQPIAAHEAVAPGEPPEEDSPIAPLPPSLFMGLIGIVMAAWASHWMKRHGWV